MAMLTTLDNVKNYLGIPLLTTTYDTFLTEQITIISDAIEQYVGRNLLTATYSQTFYYRDYDYRESNEVYLFNYPITALTSITDITNTVVLSNTDFRLHFPTGQLSRVDKTELFKGTDIQVVYVAGYTVCPSPILSVLYSLIEDRYNKKINNVGLNFGSDVQSISIAGTISISYDYSLQANESKTNMGMILGNYINVLNNYRSERPIVGNGKVAYVN